MYILNQTIVKPTFKFPCVYDMMLDLLKRNSKMFCKMY